MLGTRSLMLLAAMFGAFAAFMNEVSEDPSVGHEFGRRPRKSLRRRLRAVFPIVFQVKLLTRKGLSC